MNFVPKRRIKVEFVVPDSVEVRLGDLEEFLRNHTKKVKVRDLQHKFLPFQSALRKF